ncbi:hypothetical protein DL95DRAFT_415841 [Leptodontidium sp. 2 PMI_412]|nr:hypothetical protein DL95DRAFT_415841 [Leptodontidium sp. 2 PMI_412]
MAIVRAHIYTLLFPLLPPLNSAPRTLLPLDSTTFKTLSISLYIYRCRPIKLVDVKKKKKKKRRWPSLKDKETGDRDVDDNSFEDKDTEVGANADFGFDNHDSAVTDLGSENDSNSSDDDVIISDIKTELRQFDALYYEDVRLLVVRNPVAGERDILMIEVKLAHYKGAKRRLKPTIFFFIKVDDPIFCPITYFVSLAIIDGAFEAPSLTTVERVFEHKVDYLNRLGLEAGFLEKLTSCYFRRGTANVVNRTATDAVRD